MLKVLKHSRERTFRLTGSKVSGYSEFKCNDKGLEDSRYVVISFQNLLFKISA